MDGAHAGDVEVLEIQALVSTPSRIPTLAPVG
jgi:hypothetical protein